MARLAARISISSPLAGVSYALPVAQVGYILMMVQADINISGRYRIVFDLVSLADQASLHAGKTLRKQQAWSDALALQTVKDLADTFSITDVFARQVKTARLHTYTVNDLAYCAVSKRAQDSVQALDVLRSGLQTIKKDAFTSADVKAMALSKLFQSPNFKDFAYFLEDYVSRDYSNESYPDTVFVGDVASRLTGLGRKNPVILLDSSAQFTGKSLVDTLPATDKQNLQLSKTLQDAFGANDTAVIGDGIAFTANKEVANVVTPSDVYTSALTKALIDAATATDKGFLMSQSYSEMSYFAADYVGSSRSF